MHKIDFLRLLPDDIKGKYIRAIARNGKVDAALWNQIVAFLEINYRQIEDTENFYELVLKETSFDEFTDIMAMLKTSDTELHSILSNKLFDVEEIIEVESEIIKEALADYDRTKLAISLKGMSSITKNYIRAIFSGELDPLLIDGDNPVRMEDLTKVHNEMVARINKIILKRL
ncbi:MAG: hypothetical protein JXR48_01255 [Candidatus Delongbacteria bacterium]|nr:hypothetical protein [Candidatus Delongbacteria bacterium]MBN2833571.1 hypothetical protein [Candidatus Delongbacteria bacterium]